MRLEDRQPNGDVHWRSWQRGGGYGRYVFEPLTGFEQIEHMHANPVRRGLCAQSEDRLWSGAADYASVRVGSLRLDRDSLPVVVGPCSARVQPCPRKAVDMAPGVSLSPKARADRAF